MGNGDRNIEIGGDVNRGSFFQGDISGSNVNVDTNINESTISNIAKITIDNKFLERMPIEYADSLKQLTELLNKQLEQENIIPNAISPVTESLNKLAEETVKADLQNGIDENKKKKILDKLKSFAVSLVKVSPKIAKEVHWFETTCAF